MSQTYPKSMRNGSGFARWYRHPKTKSTLMRNQKCVTDYKEANLHIPMNILRDIKCHWDDLPCSWCDIQKSRNFYPWRMLEEYMIKHRIILNDNLWNSDYQILAERAFKNFHKHNNIRKAKKFKQQQFMRL